MPQFFYQFLKMPSFCTSTIQGIIIQVLVNNVQLPNTIPIKIRARECREIEGVRQNPGERNIRAFYFAMYSTRLATSSRVY